jgi:hypothetical protein
MALVIFSLRSKKIETNTHKLLILHRMQISYPNVKKLDANRKNTGLRDSNGTLSQVLPSPLRFLAQKAESDFAISQMEQMGFSQVLARLIKVLSQP